MMTGDGGSARLRRVKVDPFAICDLAREHNLNSTATWVLHLLAIQGEYRTGEWAGTLTDLSEATRVSRKAIARVVDLLVGKGLLGVIEPFRQGTDGRVRVLCRDRLVFVRDQYKIASIDAISPAEDRDQFATDSRPVRDRFALIDANEQGKEPIREVTRHRGSEVVGKPSCTKCGELIEGHDYNDHEPQDSEASFSFNEEARQPMARPTVGEIRRRRERIETLAEPSPTIAQAAAAWAAFVVEAEDGPALTDDDEHQGIDEDGARDLTVEEVDRLEYEHGATDRAVGLVVGLIPGAVIVEEP